MATDTSPERPAIALRCGNIKATMWQNVSEKRPSFATTFSRPFKDQSDVWRNGTSFGHSASIALLALARSPGTHYRTDSTLASTQPWLDTR